MAHTPGTAATGPTYTFTPSAGDERRRLCALEETWDAWSVARLSSVGVRTGWRCLEVGAGAGSVARWLAERSLPGGRVVATDLDTGFLEPLRAAGVEVVRHDLVRDELTAGAFNLVHTRLVLQHIAERDRALDRLVDALAPSGWLVLEELDFASCVALGRRDGEAFERVLEAIFRALSPAGFDPGCGRRLPALLSARGLSDIDTDALVFVARAGSPCAEWARMSIEALRGRLLAAGATDDREIEDALALLQDPTFAFLSPALLTTRGRRAA